MCPVRSDQPPKSHRNHAHDFPVLKAASWLVKQISFDRPDWREMSNFWSLACNVTIPVWHQLLDCGYFYFCCVLAGDVVAEAAFVSQEWRVTARLRRCNCRMDAPSRVPALKCLHSQASGQQGNSLQICRFVFRGILNKILSNSKSAKTVIQCARIYW